MHAQTVSSMPPACSIEPQVHTCPVGVLEPQAHALCCCLCTLLLPSARCCRLPAYNDTQVVFNKYAMAEVEVPDGDILFVAEKSILGKLE